MSRPRNTRERILDAARDLLRERGPRAVTVAAVAKQVGVTSPALYKHFSSRRAIVDLLRAEAFARFGAALARPTRRRKPIERLLEVGRRYVTFGLEHPNSYRLLFMSAEEFPPTERELKEPDDAGLQLLMGHIAACQADGALTGEADTFELAVACWAACHGLVSLFLTNGGDARFSRDDYEALCSRALRALLTLAQ